MKTLKQIIEQCSKQTHLTEESTGSMTYEQFIDSCIKKGYLESDTTTDDWREGSIVSIAKMDIIVGYNGLSVAMIFLPDEDEDQNIITISFVEDKNDNRPDDLMVKKNKKMGQDPLEIYKKIY